MRACAWAARCAYAASLLLLVRSYTIDCNRDYTDCDNEFRALNNDNRRAEESVQVTTSIPFLELSKLPDTTETTHFLPTIPTPKSEDANEGTVKPKGRLLDINEYPFISKHNHTEILEKSAKMDLSDINLDDDEDDFDEKSVFKMSPSNSGSMSLMPDKLLTQLQAPFHPSSHDVSAEVDICKENGVNYRIGETIPRGCEEICECSSLGTFECSPRCKHPYIRKGRKLNDPLCFETPVDECCSIMACATGNHGDLKSASTNNVPNSNVCRYGNNTYNVGAKWDVRCEQRCSCEKNSVVMCEPRCKQLPPSDICINVQDPKDSCCEIQVCDVSQDIHEEPIENATSTTAIPTEKVKEVTESTKSPTHPLVTEPIGSIKVLQNNTVQINLLQMNTTSSPVHLLLSSDAGKTYKDVELKYSNLLLNLEGGKDYVLKTKETGTKFNFTITNTDSGINEVPDDVMKALNGSDLNKRRGCHQDGKFYEIGEEFHIGCSELCECTDDETKECVILECPVHVGLEILYKGCVRWAPTPPPQPPNCCPRAARCLSDGTCHYKDTAIPNWTEVPIWLTGCEQRCFCENGELDCQEICTPLTELPPQNLRCPPGQRPAPVNVSDDDCCKEWSCVKNGLNPEDILHQKPTLPPFLPTIPSEIYPHEDIPEYGQNNIHRPNSREPQLPPTNNYPGDNAKFVVLSVQADSPNSVKMLFGLPPILVGLKGSVDLRYTDEPEEDESRWHSQVFAPTDGILSTPRLDFRLGGLKPSTTYKIKGKLFVHNLSIDTESKVFTVRTLDALTIEEKTREINSRLSVLDVNDTTAHVTWRHFTENELQFIDGIQVRYRPVGTPIYIMTELLHHSRSNAELHDLRPGSRYEASLVLIPPPRTITELHDPNHVEFTTAPYVDPYNWTVTVETRTVGSEAAELIWRGIPAPAERWVRVYRAAHACGVGRTQEHDAFRLASRDQPNTITLTGLEPNSRCRMWLELFLTNGKVKTSNVLEVNTKSLEAPETVDNVIEASSVMGGRDNNNGRGNYYGALVAVGVVAALGALTSLLLLLVVVRRHRPHSVSITTVPSAPRESSLPPYDNPAYKLELQQETMDL